MLLLLTAATFSQAQPTSGFMPGQSIYQVFTDRFFDGNAANNNASGSFNASSGTGVHGGDFQGIEQKLDYIKALGATAIWISPIVLNGSGEYHGYAGKNFYQVDPHWGTLSNLQSMVNAAHARGLLVIQDVVVNHGGTLVQHTVNNYTFNYPTGYTLRYTSAGNQYASPFQTNASQPNLTNIFHNYGDIQDYNNTQQIELGALSGLDDFRTETAYIRTNMAAVFNYWIQTVGFDGFRVDTVKHCEMGFWQDWCPRIHAFAATNGKPNFFMFGEVFDGSDTKCGSYSGAQGGGAYKLDSLLDYPLFFSAQSVFGYATGNTKQIEDHYNALPANYDPATQNQLVTFLDNHDTTRFLNSANANGNTNRLIAALTFLHTSRGVPCVYQGTEQAFNGGADPNNREDMFAGAFEQGPSLGDNFNMAHPIFQHIAKLNNLRRLYPALRNGSHVNLWNTPGGPGLFAYSRQLSGTQEVFVVLNTASTTQALPARPTLYSPGTILVNLLDTNETLTVVAGSVTPAINVPAMSAKLFLAQSQLLPLNPVVTSISPAHDATSVSAIAPLTIQFNQPMDTNSVQAAFTTTPAVTGNFAWSPARDTLTFTPTVSWPGVTLMKVRIADTAQALAGTTNRLFAAFDSRFTTATASDLVKPTVTLTAPTNGAIVSGQLTLSGTAADNVSVQKVEVRVDNGAWLTASGTTSWSYSLNTSNFLNGTHILAARSTDTAANISLTNSVTVRFINVPSAYLQRVACGNVSNITNCDGTLWQLDIAYTSGGFGYIGGGNGYVANNVIGICAAAQSLYQRERFGNFSYRFDCPMGVYETTLLEAETYWTAIGQRTFNVSIEGSPTLTSFDIFAAAGGQNLPLTRVFTNSVADSQLEIMFTPVVDNARVSGLQVRKIADLFSGGDGIPDWWRLAYFDHTTGLAGDNSRATDDADGDGASNLNEYLAGTNPLAANSVFHISSYFHASGTNAVLWTTVTNRTYQLQQCDALNGTNAWIDVGSSRIGTGNTLTQSVTGPDMTARFFRVRAQ